MEEHLWTYDIGIDRFICTKCQLDWKVFVNDMVSYNICQKPKPKSSCDCGGETFNSHSHWCSTQKDKK